MFFANSHKRDKVFREVIFENNREAMDRISKVGKDAVVNGTIGAFMTDGKLNTFESVDKFIDKIDIKKSSAYSPLKGLDRFLVAAKGLCFEEFVPKRKSASVAVVGGLGGIRQALVNYTEIGDALITSDWYWGPYEGIAEENYRRVETFNMIGANNSFDIESFKNKIYEVAQKQENIFIILNTPAHNPTGYTIKIGEWNAIIAFLNSLDKKVVLFLDVAYLEFSDRKNKMLFKHLDMLSENVLTIVNYSISKGFAKYGFRTAALIALHSDETVLEEFRNIITISNRGTYGSIPSIGQYLTASLYEDKNSLKQYYEEKEYLYNILKKRADAFLSTINNKLIMPYDDGFFISIRVDNHQDIHQKLKDENIFLVPMKTGIRVAICSIHEDDLVKVASAINKLC